MNSSSSINLCPSAVAIRIQVPAFHLLSGQALRATASSYAPSDDSPRPHALCHWWYPSYGIASI